MQVSLELIDIPEDRHRTDPGDLEGLMTSIRARGLLNPIILEPAGDRYILRAGFRRFSAHRKLGKKKIEARLFKDLNPLERELIELEENLHRSNLTWDEEAKGIRRIHNLLCESDPEWTQTRTADHIGVKQAHISKACAVAAAVEQGKLPTKGVTSINAAHNIMRRKIDRAASVDMSRIANALPVPEGARIDPAPLSIIPPEQSILNESFLDWAPAYTGQRFNLIHCDFPYGINFGKSAQAGSSVRWESYQDDKDIYAKLLECMTTHWENFASPSCHLVFWHSFSTYEYTRQALSRLPGIRIWPNLLVWHKSDNKGVLADPERGPRHTYEVALLASFGDRKIVKAKADSVSAPTGKSEAIHQSEKPVPMLKHFLEMLVDETTRLLDPTCGSASALRAAEALGAKSTLGLEINPDYVDVSRSTLGKDRKLRLASDVL